MEGSCGTSALSGGSLERGTHSPVLQIVGMSIPVNFFLIEVFVIEIPFTVGNI